MIKFILTAVIIYFLVRSIANKPWLSNRVHIHESKAPKPPEPEPSTPHEEDDFVEYEEVE
jgi:hypothetical protein